MTATNQQNEESHAPLHDDLAPEPDTKAGGSYIVMLIALWVALLLAWGFVNAIYRVALTTIHDGAEERLDIRFAAVQSRGAELLNGYATTTDEEAGTTAYQIPVGAAQDVLLSDPSLLAGLPGVPAQSSSINEPLELPELPDVSNVELSEEEAD